jgi:Lrp/AsnC family transcriptional regulator, regulator for asnA, asnC and gidA
MVEGMVHEKLAKKTIEKKLDDLDTKIIKELLKNSRKPFAEIAGEYKVSTLTISKRYNELVKKGIIVGSSVLIDYAHFGIEYTGVLYVNVNTNQLRDFTKYLNEIEGDFSVLQRSLIEKFNVIVFSRVTNLKELEKLKETIKQHPALIDIETNIWTYMKVDLANLSMEP